MIRTFPYESPYGTMIVEINDDCRLDGYDVLDEYVVPAFDEMTDGPETDLVGDHVLWTLVENFENCTETGLEEGAIRYTALIWTSDSGIEYAEEAEWEMFDGIYVMCSGIWGDLDIDSPWCSYRIEPIRVYLSPASPGEGGPCDEESLGDMALYMLEALEFGYSVYRERN